MPLFPARRVVVCRLKRYTDALPTAEYLRQSGITAFVQQELIGGVMYASLPSPASGPGIDYSVLVPEPQAESALTLLATFPPAAAPDDPGPWGFLGGNQRLRRFWRWAVRCALLVWFADVLLSLLGWLAG
ncbi:MAG TPA: hypothetical protein PKM88_15295 [bacterium]|nr:hypothetical protein [bacterium]